MASKLGSLTLDLIARVGDFVGPIQQAENQSNSSFNNMRNHINNYGTAVVAVAGAAVVGLAAMTSEYVDQAAELERMAFRSNATTQEFQRLAAGAAAYGIEQETLSGQLKDFNEKLGELTTLGSGAGLDFFEQIAMKTEGGAEGAKKLILQMQKLSGPQALQLYINKLEEAGVSHQQMSFYLESMGGDLTELIPLFANGGEAAKIYGDAAERAGIIMSDNTIQQTKILKEQVYLLDLQMQGAKNQLMQAVIPAFVDISEAFFGGSEQGLQFTEVASGVATSLKFVAKMAIGVVTSVQLAGKAMGAMAAVYASIQDHKDWYEFGALGTAKAMFDARKEIAQIGSAYLSDANVALLQAGEKMDRIDNGVASKEAEALVKARGLRKATDGVTDGLDAMIEKQNKASTSTTKQTKETKKLNDELKVNALVQANASKYGFSNIEDQYKLPKGLLSAVNMQESRGKSDVIGPMTKYGEAKGGFQFLDTTAKRFNLMGDDVFNTGKSAEAAAKYFQYLYEKFGTWEKAISAYHAGEGNVDRGTGIGPINRQYVKNVMGYMDSALQHVGTTANDAVQYVDEAYNLQKSVASKYMTEIERITFDHQSLIREINEAFAENDPSRQKYLDLQKAMYQKDLGEFNKAQAQKQFDQINSIKSMQEQIKDIGAGSDDIFAKATMTQSEYSSWSLKNNHAEAQKGLRDQLTSVEQNIVLSDVYTDDDDRYQALLEAHEEYLYVKNALDVQYGEQVNDLAHAQYESQMGQYSQMISIASDTWGRMTSVIKDAQGENSAAYKAMFFVQQTMAAAQAIIYANVASAAALAPPPIGLGPVAGMPLSGMIKGSGYANAALIMAQGLAGMAHNGIDNIPKEGTWLLDGGERVLNPQQNKDLTNYLSKSKPQGANIVINNNGSSKVVATQGSDGKTYITIDELPGLVAGQLRNPNSQISKSVQQNTTATRRR